MENISDLTSRVPSGSRRTRSRLLMVLLVSAVLLSGFTGTAAAQVTDPADVICGGDSTTNFTNTLQSLMTLFVVGGPVIGTVMAVYYQVAASAKPDGDYQDDRKKALIAGWSVPVLVYMLQIISNVVLGFDLACIVPGG